MKRNILSGFKENEPKTEKVEIEVAELFDDEGNSQLFEILSIIKHLGKEYLVLTPFVEDESKINVGVRVPAEVFIMKKNVHDDGEQFLEALTDSTIVKKIFEEFKEKNSDEYDFANTDISTNTSLNN